MRTKRIAITILCGLVAVLAACGGGEETAPAAPPVADQGAAPAPTPPAGAAGPSGTASVSGTVTYAGEVPALRALDMAADPACQAKHSEPVMPDVLVLGDGQTLGNVFVRVTGGLPDGQWPVPQEAAVIDQQGCQYLPHVIGVMTGQPLKFLNSDGILHNVHALPEENQEFNVAMPAERKEAEHTFSRAEDMFRVKCDVHPWMNAWVAVMPHPFFATTDADGRFTIEGLPAGQYEVEAWHERLGTQTASVTVADGESGTADFSFSRAES